jgi:hypothetical protein
VRYADRIRETTTTTGTGTLNLGGAVSGFVSFVSGVGTGSTVYYLIQHRDPAFPEWEIGVGTVTDATPDTLSRSRIVASSNSGNAVNFTAGTKDVRLVNPALAIDGANQILTAVRVATTTSGTLASSFENGDTVDGVTLATGDRILIRNQGTASENGVYVVAASGAPLRSSDMFTGTLANGVVVPVLAGTVNGGRLFACTNVASSATVGTSSLTFVATAAPVTHASQHQHGGSDEVAVATPAANAIPKAGAGGTLNSGWIPDLSGTYQPLDPDLTAIAGLTSAADKGIYFTGSGTAATFDLTSFGRSLAGSANASGARGTLGLSGMAIQDPASVSITGGSITGITDLAVADGGTGASTAPNARTNLGLGSGDSPTFAALTLTGSLTSGQLLPVATIAIIGGDSTTDATAKSFRMGSRHYMNSEEPVAAFVISSSSTTNVVNYGGGSGVFNAATQLAFYAAANNTTTTGTKWLDLQSGIFAFTDALNVSVGTSSGTKWGTATSQKQAWWNATPVVQQVLATGGGATVDNVITLLQTLGLCRQS